jgi:hypothetical protein
MIVIFAVGASALVSMLVGYAIGRWRGRGGAGAWLGLLGPVGWIIAALLPEEGRRCPECLGVVPEKARRCRHCGSVLADVKNSAVRAADLR